MKTHSIPHTPYQASKLAHGCMNLGNHWRPGDPTTGEIKTALETLALSLELGINIFDHADIYCFGRSEKIFGEIWEAGLVNRDEIILQSKCGIRFPRDGYGSRCHHFDFSFDHITSAVDGILGRLKTEYLDILLLHRPDMLIQPEEVARAFSKMHASGKVKYFGVSNHTASQMDFLQRSLDQPLVANQVQLNIIHAHAIDSGIVAGRGEQGLSTRGENIIEYCRSHQIQIQAYSPLVEGYLSGREVRSTHSNADRIRNASGIVAEIAQKNGVSQEAVVLSWLLRHPAGIQPVIGTNNHDRLKACAEAGQVELTREQWYNLYVAGRGRKLP